MVERKITVVTLTLVPVFYSIAVKDLKIVKWEPAEERLPTTDCPSRR